MDILSKKYLNIYILKARRNTKKENNRIKGTSERRI